MRDGDTVVFNAEAHKKTVREMAERGESVHSEGERIYRQTGKLNQNVNIFGVKRMSRNAFVKNDDGTCLLLRGIKMPTISQTDGTGSFGENVAKAFFAMEGLYARLNNFDKYQIDLSVSVVQDVSDRHPVVQMAEFESDNRAAEHVKMLIPDKDGGDAIEDYDLGLWYVDNCVETDIVNYGLKGYYFLLLDNIGRGVVHTNGVENHLGHKMQGSSIKTEKICENLLTKWHLFCIQADGSDNTTRWWQDKMGEGRVIVIDDSDLLAEVQAGLVYVTETINPTENGLYQFLLEGESNKKNTEKEARKVWQWLQIAKQHFGAQANLPGYDKIPKPGDIFANYRDVWPIGHNDEIKSENIPIEEQEPTDSKTKINWNNF